MISREFSELSKEYRARDTRIVKFELYILVGRLFVAGMCVSHVRFGIGLSGLALVNLGFSKLLGNYIISKFVGSSFSQSPK